MSVLKIVGVNNLNRKQEVEINLASILNGTIGTGLTVSVDIIPVSSLVSVRYEVVMWTTVKTNSMTVVVSNDSSGIIDTVFGISGSRILASIDSTVAGLNMKLDITNNELETINYKIEKK